jgi:hypothetical protein
MEFERTVNLHSHGSNNIVCDNSFDISSRSFLDEAINQMNDLIKNFKYVYESLDLYHSLSTI